MIIQYDYDKEFEYDSEQTVDYCKIFIKHNKIQTHVDLLVFNLPHTKKRYVAVKDLLIKINDWYYRVPTFIVWITTYHIERIYFKDLHPVDNLTYIEELAKEKNLNGL